MPPGTDVSGARRRESSSRDTWAQSGLPQTNNQQDEDDVIDTHVSSLIAGKKAAERIRDISRDPKLRNADLLLLTSQRLNCAKQME